MYKLKKIKTACRECIFAEYNGITQTGCQLNKIYKYSRNGVEVIPAYDDETEFFIINGAICNTYRKQKWADKYKNQDLIKLVKEETKLNYSLFLSYDGTEIHPFPEIINNILKLDIPPKSLYILNRSNENHSGFMIKNYKRNWREINILDKERIDFDYVHQMIISRKIKTFFYLNLPSWYEDINSLINNINAYFDNLKEILAIIHNGMVVGALTNMNIVFGRNFLSAITDENKILKLKDLK